MEEINVLFLIIFVSLGQTPKIKICHMVASEHPKVVEGRRKLISMDVLDLRRQTRMVQLIIIVLIWMKRMMVFQERQMWEQL